MDVVCTAGHVDHGKSTLVRALTGMEPDRFDEERRRGLTIDLGFAWAEIAAGDRSSIVAFVDLPGHERFIANMLAGAGPVEAALFVVAADEGWKPQSQEHLDILDILGVRTGVVVLTKRDAVDSAQALRVRDDVEQRLQPTSLAGAAIVEASAATGEGLDEVRQALLEALGQRRSVRLDTPPRLWIDRSFSIKGAGTVVTGTLAGGTLKAGDDVVVLPDGHHARVRGLQSLEQTVVAANAGDRVAVNLVGVDRGEVQRGHLLAVNPPPSTAVVDAEIRTLHGSAVGRRGAWHLHAGSGRWTVRIRPYGSGPIHDRGFASIMLDGTAPLVAGERFVLRDSGSRTTVGGGAVLDAYPLPVRGAQQRRERIAALERRSAAVAQGDTAALLAMHVTERRVAAGDEAATAFGLTAEQAATAARAHRLLQLGGAWVHPQAAAEWSTAVTQALQHYHREHPLERAAPRAVAQQAAEAAGCPGAHAGDLVAVLLRVGRVHAEGSGLRHPDHQVALSDSDNAAATALVAALEREPFAPPRLSAAAGAAGATPALVKELEASGRLVRLGSDLVMTDQAVQAAAAALRRRYAESGPLTAAQAKETWGTSRKFAVPLLEELDRRGITRRDGDIRHVR